VEFEFDEDQLLLRQSVRETLAKTSALPSDELWATYTALGWLEAPPVELAIVLDELGYVADPTPFLATATWFAPLAGRLPEGSGTGVFDGAGRFVLDADRADEVALLTGDGVVVVSGAEVTAERVDTFDLRLHVAHLTSGDPGGGPVTSVGPGGVPLVAGVPDLALMGLAVTTVGACRRILDLVVAHVKQRHQFGAAIGSFQAVKHKAADMYLAIERARVLAYYAALTIAEDDPGRHRAAVMAKAAAGECQEVVYRNGTQLFGAMGFTWENELHVYLKRAVAANLLLGSATVQRKALLAMEVAALCGSALTPRSRSSGPSSPRSSTSTCRPPPRPANGRGRARTSPSGRAAGSGRCSTRAGCCPVSRPSTAVATPPSSRCSPIRKSCRGGGSTTASTRRVSASSARRC
jgi:hypothetical protein